MGKLSDLANFYGTDKRPEDHNYTPVYEFWLKNLDVKTMLEVGFGNGASARMWLDYYPDAKVYCIEYKGDEYENVWEKPNLHLPRLNVRIGDSTKKETWDDIPYNLDLIVEDGSHYASHQIETFKLGFAHLSSGGIYFIEDTHCGFEEKYGKDNVYDYIKQLMVNQQASHVQTGGDFYKARPYMDDMTKEIYSIHSYKSLVVLQKA